MNKKIVSLFSGGGGLDLGFLWQGFEIIWASDINKNAVSTYRKNIGNHIILGDINDINLVDIPKANILIGGPPCQSFSLAGKRNTEDLRGQLVWRYLEILKHVNPEAFVFENVTGITSAKTKEGNKVLDELIKKFEDLGYSINWEVLNSADYGVPQRRKRVIIVGLKGLKKFEFPKKTHFNHISVEEALGDLPAASTTNKDLNYLKCPSNNYQTFIRDNSKLLTEHTIPTMSDLDKFIVKHVKPGGNYNDIPDTVASDRIKRLKKEGGRTTCYGRLDPKYPSYTINTYFNRPNVGCNIHYKYDRLLTIREALRLQSFPDSYQLVSSSKQGKHTIVGNAVPPLLAQQIALKLKEYI